MEDKKFLALFILGIIFVPSLFTYFICADGIYFSYIQILINNAPILFKFILIIPLIFFVLICLFLPQKREISLQISIILSVLSSIFFFTVISYSKYLFNEKFQTINPYISLFVLGFSFLIFAVYLISFKKAKFQINIKEMTEISLLIAIAIILDQKFLKIPININGGSISLCMLPLIIISLRYGFTKGFIASGLIFSFITCALDGYGLIYFPFDYLLGFGSLAIFGVLKNKIFSKSFVKDLLFILIFTILAFILRTLSSTISGIIFYKLNFLSSLIYQLSYIPLSFVACFIGLIILYIPLKMIKKRDIKYSK